MRVDARDPAPAAARRCTTRWPTKPEPPNTTTFLAGVADEEEPEEVSASAVTRVTTALRPTRRADDDDDTRLGANAVRMEAREELMMVKKDVGVLARGAIERRAGWK